ncbi:hypothetical protein HRbin21_00858 [bacterium HR21]|nr:hypothetical protein HRbin21_00858 [bacterium HR21]
MKRVPILLLLVALCCARQTLGQLLDSRGREFWCAFLPNYHNNRFNPNPALRYGDSLYLFLVAEQPCSGFIEWWDNTGQHNVERFQIADPRIPYVFARSWWGLELMGYNDSGTLSPAEEQTEIPVRQSVHIVVEEGGEITVYALQQGVYTSDASLLLPSDALGTEYLVMSYPSHSIIRDGSLTNSSTPSQFAIIATEDQTTVIIRPSAPTRRNWLQREQVIQLNRGQVYLVQAFMSQSVLRADLTGTEILATKPIAVLAGHQRALIPVELDGQLSSRDMLLEQLPPVTAWGRSALIAPFPDPSTPMAPVGTHRYRVLAAQPNTVLFVNGQQVAVLGRGQFYEGSLTQPLEIRATGPILVAAFFKTTNASSSTSSIGDPFMMLIPPAEQFLPGYRFINAQKYDYDAFSQRYEPVYQDQYATAVIPEGAQLWLDGQPVPSTLFRPIGVSGYLYAWLLTGDGVHEIQARFPDGSPAPLGLYVYGYGPANSYGYVGGMSYRPLDVSPPVVATQQSCFALVGTIYDTASGDSRLRSVEVLSSDNVDISLEALGKPADSVRFQATLIDLWRDGTFQLRARDSSGLEQIWKFDIPGFTLRVEPAALVLQLLVDDQLHCAEFTLRNVGSFPRRIEHLRFLGNLPPQASVTVEPPDSVVLPGESRRVRLCFVAVQKGRYEARLLLADSCLVVDSAAQLLVILGADEEPPTVQRWRDSCGWEEVLVVSDTVLPASGIAAVEVLQEVNCTVTWRLLDSLRGTVQVRVQNPFEDAWYAFRVRDRAGNERVVADTLPGFTVQLRVPQPGVLTVPPSTFGELRCEPVLLVNTGRFPVRIETVPLRRQTAFSVPPGQLPLVIPPGESRELRICFAPLTPQLGQYEDTLQVGTACVALPLVVRSQLVGKDYVGTDRCGVHFRLEQGGAVSFLDPPFPQPAAEELIVRFGVAHGGPLWLELSDIHGRSVVSLLWESVPAGIYHASLSVATLPPGVYWLRLRTGTTSRAQPVLIAR